jgi:glutathione S-transferase
MAHKLYVVHGSHPCHTVVLALQLKGIPYKTVELPHSLHAAIQRVRFGERTVPSMRLEGGEKIQGSRRILRRLEELVPQPSLYPADPALGTAVAEAERWGDEVFQSIARRLLWIAFQRRPRAMTSYLDGSRLPLPAPVVRASAPLIVMVEKRLNAASPEAAARDLAELPGHLDRIDGWFAEGVLGGAQLSAADLQIAPTARLLMSIGDVAPMFEGRPSAELARRLWPEHTGSIPAGALTTPVAEASPA